MQYSPFTSPSCPLRMKCDLYIHASYVYARLAPAAVVDGAGLLLAIQLIPTLPSSQAVASQPAFPAQLFCQSRERIFVRQEPTHFAGETHIIDSRGRRCLKVEDLTAFE